jgi:hypothetical protein
MRDIFRLIGPRLLILAIVLGAGLLALPSADARDDDHFKCYDILADERPPGTTPIDFIYTGVFPNENGCYIRNKAREICVPAAKKLTEESRRNDPRGGSLGTIAYLCYDLVCRNPVNRFLEIDDQFEERDITIRATRRLCAPFNFD